MSSLMTSARRVLWLVVLGAAAGALYTWWGERKAPPGPIDPPEWPPLHAVVATPATTDTVDSASTGSTTPNGRRMPPNDDGSCPDGFPIKANDNSGIYHLPTGRFYGRTKAERCYATAEQAEADGYRAAKS